MRVRKTAATATAVVALWLARAAADMPYPRNLQPCAGAAMDSSCIAATDFAAYLFLPATTPLTLPDDFDNDWELSSQPTGNPTIDANPQELFGVTGASVDRAWQITTGRPDVLLAVLDSGIEWADPQPELVNKFYLNRGELPVPEGSMNALDPHDRNGDGVFNIADYLADGVHPQDSRVSDQNGNGVIDPEDLIFLFSDGVDDDGNGYVDDISGWDFFEDDNDPLDEVSYGHGTGASKDSAAEANNGVSGVGTCPNCLLLEVRVGDSFVTEANHFAQGAIFAVDSGARVIQEALGTLNQSSFGQQAVDYAFHGGVIVIASAADEESEHHNFPASYSHTIEVNSVTHFADFNGFKQSPPSYLYLNGCTNYGAHIALSVPSSSCSSEATGKSAGIAGLVVSAALNAIEQGTITYYPRDNGTLTRYPLSADEVTQILIQSADDIDFDARNEPPLPQNYSTTIVIPLVQQQSERFPSIAGYDQYFGYGRINADTAVRRVASGQIPPEASIDAPSWFEVVDPERSSQLTISGHVAANRAQQYQYVLEAAPGVQPRDADFQTVTSAGGLTEATRGVLGQVDLRALAARMPHGVEGPAITDDGLPDPDRFTVTIRVRVMDNHENIAEDRRALALHHDPDLLDGFPLALGGDGDSASVTADLDGDGREEIVLGSSDGLVHALRADGSELAGWPVHTDPMEIHAAEPGYSSGAIATPVYSSVLGAVSVGDLDRDGTLEVVATDLQGRAYVWEPNGRRRSGFPVKTLADYSFSFRSERDTRTDDGRVPDRVNRHTRDNRLGRALLGGAALGNLDGSADGSLEIVAGAFDRHLYAWRNDGTPLPGWPVLLKDPAKVAAVDPVTNEVKLADNTGRMGTKILVPPSLGDIDGDGTLDVVAAVNEEYRETPNAVFRNATVQLFQRASEVKPGNTRLYAVHHDGVAHGGSGMLRGWNPAAFLDGWPVKPALVTTELLPTVGTGSNGPPALADVDGDGLLEVGTMSAIGPAYVFRSDGVSFFGRLPTGEDRTLDTDTLGTGSNSTDAPTFGALGAVAMAEFAGRGNGFHLIAPTAGLGKFIDEQIPARQFPADNHLTAWKIADAAGTPADGSLLPAFPRIVNDLQILAGPALADLDGDGLPEAIEPSGLYDLHAVDIDGKEAPGWPKFTNGWMVQSAAVGDVDGDGKLEVVASTREGRLFVWKTTGDECGAIPWRRWHHDEWGSGNYGTDARPPASLQSGDAYVTPTGPSSLRIDLTRIPGNDLYCGNATFDVRIASAPITDESTFATAHPLTVTPVGGRRGPGTIVASSDQPLTYPLYLALIAKDASGNRSTLVAAAPVLPTAMPTTTAVPTATATEAALPSPTTIATVLPSPTDTAVASPTSTITAVAPPTATVSATTMVAETPTATASSIVNVTATVPATATSTQRRSSDDDGCAIVPPAEENHVSALALIPGIVLLLRRHRKSPRSQ
jgi:hypothetical protein